MCIHNTCFSSLTLKDKSLRLSVDGFHSLCHCSHISLCECVLLNEVLDTCQVLPIVLRLQRDLGAEREEERVREKRERVEEEGQVEGRRDAVRRGRREWRTEKRGEGGGRKGGGGAGGEEGRDRGKRGRWRVKWEKERRRRKWWVIVKTRRVEQGHQFWK